MGVPLEGKLREGIKDTEGGPWVYDHLHDLPFVPFFMRTKLKTIERAVLTMSRSGLI